MSKVITQLSLADSGHSILIAKRTAFEELNTTRDVKRTKGLHDGSTEPDAKPPAITRRVPFPDKVPEVFNVREMF